MSRTLVLAFTLAVSIVLPCACDTEESTSETSTCPEPPECSGGELVEGSDGCMLCSYPGITSCADCEADEYCVTCYAVHDTSISCVLLPTLGPGYFRCDWVACAPGQVCISTYPAGDGCPDARCVALPAACESDVTCSCVSGELGGDCSQDGDGNITLTGMNGSISG
ncbi:MAG: hypothetical protein JRI68_29205 [Deltaproteobacteria bacterium]|nr:hypothetical protein [Deltaproteobacteria bacterium]